MTENTLEYQDEDDSLFEPMTQEEWSSIAKALANQLKGSGHCYQCPQDHPYFVEDCGTPIHITQCFLCQSQIGGEGELIKGNQFDSKLDQLVASYQLSEGKEKETH